MHYPKSPVGVPKEVTQPSASFKNGVRKITLALVFFAVIYLALLAFGVGLAVSLGVLGGFIIVGIHHFLGIALGIGLMLTGLMVLYFLVKFLFESKKDERSLNLEISEEDFPDLFEFIRRLSIDTQTDFPKHIYVSPNVNAAVFYDSNFQSMFFPVKKNLLIGLGLVNSVNVSEFKAVLAHEFGHFSQKSMRAGSYVYQVNKVMVNMLYNNEGYGRILNKWASIHGIFALCANFTVKIVELIQWVQRLAYKMVNKQFYGLAQQMEYHADAVAAATCGSNNLVQALRRIEFGDECYNKVLQKYNSWLDQGLKAENIYHDQRIASEQMAGEYRLRSQNGLPVLAGDSVNYKGVSRVSIDNQWASHPTLQQREDALNKINITGEVVDEPAWILFGDVTDLQQKLTADMYQDVKFKVPVQLMSTERFSEKYSGDSKVYAFPVIYDLFYHERRIMPFEPTSINQPEQITDIADFFVKNAQLNSNIGAMESDIRLLGEICNNPTALRSFNFDGVKYKTKEAAAIKTRMELEMNEMKETLQHKDEAVYAYCMARPGVDNEAKKILSRYYGYYFRLQELCGESIGTCLGVSGYVTLLRQKTANSTATKKMEEDAVEQLRHCQKKLVQISDFLSDPEVPYKFILTKKLNGLINSSFASLGKYGLQANDLDNIEDNINELATWSIDIGIKCQKELLEKQMAYL